MSRPSTGIPLLAATVLSGWSGMGLAADLPATASAPAVLPAFAGFYAHLGASGLVPDAGARIRVGGVKAPGASIAIPATVTASLELGYYLTPNWAVSLTIGVPPRAEIEGRGTITPLGKLGSTVAGASTATAHYHFTQFGAFQPYVGGGVAYLTVFGSTDGALSRFHLDGAFGAVGQVGADLMLTERVGVFVDLKKAYLRTTSTGLFAGRPMKADVKLDPLALTGGLVVRF